MCKFWYQTHLSKLSMVECDSMQIHKSRLIERRYIFLQYLAQAFAADCIFESPCISIRWVRALLSMNQAIEKKSRQSRDSNPGLLGEKGKHYLCAMQPPPPFKMQIHGQLLPYLPSTCLQSHEYLKDNGHELYSYSKLCEPNL